MGLAFVQFASPSTTKVLECEGWKSIRMMEMRIKGVEGKKKVPMGLWELGIEFLLLCFLSSPLFMQWREKEDMGFLLFRVFFFEIGEEDWSS